MATKLQLPPAPVERENPRVEDGDRRKWSFEKPRGIFEKVLVKIFERDDENDVLIDNFQV